MTAPLIRATSQGLYCEEGDFHIDPWRAVPSAVITHAHADHATRGCTKYLTSTQGKFPLSVRMQAGADIQPLAYREQIEINNARVTLFPAGHVLGSAQVRVERIRATTHGPAGETWVVTGDYKTTPDRTCEPFDPVTCDTFLTESTFALPIYRFPPADQVEREINAWWERNAADERTSMILAYSLGKAQRILAALDPSNGPIGVHGAIIPLNDAYHKAGISLPSVIHAKKETAGALKGKGIIVAPPSAANSPWSRTFLAKGGMSTASASGWMRVRGRRRWQALDTGFILSDHADWPGLLSAVEQSCAPRIGVTHGRADVLARFLAEQKSLETFVVETRFTGDEESQSEANSEVSSDPSSNFFLA